MFAKLKNLGDSVGSMQTWFWILFTVIPAGATTLMGWVQGVPWSLLIFFGTGAAALGAALIYFIMCGWDYTQAKISKAVEKSRIIGDLRDYQASGYPIIDLPTVAAIWADTRDENNTRRHLCFRKLKAAVSSRLIAMVNPPGGEGEQININTLVVIDDVIRYFEKTIFI